MKDTPKIVLNKGPELKYKTVYSYSDSQKTMEQNDDSNLQRVDDFTKQV